MEGWSRWNLSGYESKSMWPHYLATAQVNAGPLKGPRLVFEHDPANSDLGSTRALEALPMFGSRPALEGLYMESATSGPFIYQLQAEISQHPSSPLSRYPSSARSLDAAIGHLNEFYANRLILRSPEKQALFGADPRFRLVAQHGPLQTYELVDLQTQLVEVAVTPLALGSRDDWLGHAFRRFLLHFPYQERYVFLAPDEKLPDSASDQLPGQVDVKMFTRERLVFETDRPGQPHLIRMTYHPRWTSTGGEPIYLTEPSFMLIYPRSSKVELVYGRSRGDRVGSIFSLSGVLLLVWGLRRRAPFHPSPESNDPPAGRRRFFGFVLVLSVVILVAWWSDPEHAYQRGHQHFNESDWSGAAALFDQAFAGRRSPARKSEALFWAARTLDLGGMKDDAAARYEKLRANYPQSYWYPESVFRLIEIRHLNGENDRAKKLQAELVEAVPDNRWTREAQKFFGEAKSAE